MATELSQQIPTHIAFIFNNVANYARLVSAFRAGVEVHVLDAAQDGLGQMAAILAGRDGIEALHVVGHGVQGSLDLGSVTLDSATLGSHGDVLGRIGSALAPGGDILLYGCDVGADAPGARFVGAIARATGADVAASTDKTGGVRLGGNWMLEQRSGVVEADGALDISAAHGLDTLLAPVVKDVTDVSQKSPGNFVPGFTLTTSEAVLGDPDPAVDGIYFDEGGKTASFSVMADGSSVATFDLTGMTFLKLLDAYPHFRITINGHKAGGGTATARIEFAEGSTTPTTPDDFSDMTGLTGFDVTITVVTVEGGGAWDLTLDGFTVDKLTAPTPGTPDLATGSDSGLSSSDNITSANAVGFSGTGVTGASVLVFIDRNGNGMYDAGTDVGGTATVAGGAWSVSGLSTLGLNGSYEVYAQQTVDGAVSGLSTALDLTIDHSAPALAIASSKTALKAGETATITFTFSEDPGASFGTGDIVVSGGTLSGLTTTGAVRTAVFTPTANTDSGTATITVAAGSYADTAGNNGGAGATPSMSFDTRAPTVTVSSSATALLVGQTATITFTFSEDPGASFGWNGSTGDLVVTGGTLGAISGSGTTRTATFTADGSDTTAGIQVTAGAYTDTAGNAGAGGASPSISVTSDSTPPAAPSVPDLGSASDSGSVDSDNLTNDTTPSFTGTAEADATVTLYDGATEIGSATADGSGNWSITSTALAAGPHSITAVATDAAGNTGAASAALNVTIDVAAPSLTISSDKASLTMGETATITFTFSEDPGASFSAADIVVTGGTLGELSGSGLTRTATFTPNTNTDGGAASITVAAGAYADAAGNPGGAGGTPALSFDTLAPSLSITSDKATLKAGETATITFTFSEDPGASFTLADVTVAGGTLGELAGSGLVRTATFTPAADTNGGNASIGVAGGAYTDAAGNGGAGGSAAIAVDTLAPSAPSAPVLDADSDTGLSASDRLTSDTTPTVSGSAEAGATITLYDGATEIGSTTADGSGNWSITSTALAAGTHSITAVATDAAGNTGAASAALNVTIDGSAPALTISSDKAALKLGETATITFTFSEDPHTSFDLADVAVLGGTLSALAGTGLVRTAIFTPAANTNGGNASITVAAGAYADAAGNPGGAGGTPALSFDTLAPSLSITSDKATLKLGETATITFTFSEDPGASFTLADVTVAGGTLGELAGSGLVRTATFTPAADTNGGNASIGVAGDAYTDAAGNGGAASSAAIAVDTLAPSAPSAPVLDADSDTGLSASDRLTSDTTPTVSGSAEAGATVTLYDGATEIGSTTADGSGNWSITSAALAVGTHSITAVATDAAGNTGAASAALNVTIDGSAPALAISSDKAALNLGETATITFSFSEDPDTSFDLADVAVSGGTLSALGGIGLVRTATFTPAANTNGGNASITVAAGAYADAAGNPGGAGGTTALSFDTLAPSLSITSDKASLKAGETATITFTFSEDPGASFTLADLTVAGGTLGELAGSGLVRTAIFTPAADTNGGNASIGVAGGTYTDAAGNGGAGGSAAIAVDTLAPSAPSAPVLDADSDTGLSASDRLTSDTTPTVSGSAEAGATITLYDGATEIGSTTADGSGNWSITSSALAAGTHSLTAVATDAAGNTGAASAALNVTIDGSAPALAITSDKAALKLGETATITFSFSEDPDTSFDLADVAVSGGTLSALGGIGLVRTATFTPAANTNGGNASITVAAGAYADAAGNPGGAGGTLAIAFDTLAPTLAITSDKASLKLGETATITFTFSEDPGASFTLADLTVAGGTLGELAGSGTTRTALFTPSPDVNGGSASIAVDGGVYADAAGNAGSAAAAPAMSFDTLAPVASTPDLTAASDDGASSSDNLTSDATPTFSGVAEEGATVTLYDGATVIGATVASGGTWTITSSVLSDGMHAISTIVSDAAGNASARSAALDVRIDTVEPPPDRTGPTATVAISDEALTIGETATVTISFSEAVTRFTQADLDAPNARLSGLSSADGGKTWTALLAPESAVEDPSNVLTLDLGGVLGKGGVPGTGSVTSANYTVSTTRPTASIEMTSRTLTQGGVAELTIRFSEAVSGFELADISCSAGSISRLSSIDGITWSAILTASSGNIPAAIGIVTLDVGGVRNAAGNSGMGETWSKPYVVLPPSAVPKRVDGVDTYTQPVTTSTGAPGRLLVIPATSAQRSDDPATPNSTLADIPLAMPGQDGGAVPLYASLPAGVALQADGPQQALGRNQALQDLIDRIESRTAPGSSSQQEMSGLGTSFLAALGEGAMVQSQTIVLTSDNQSGSGTPITITGAAPSAASVAGVVIDATALPPGATLQLDHVQFAAVVGDLRVVGGAGRNIVVGDGGRQTIFLGEDDDVLSGGGGDDSIGSAGGDDVLDGGAGHDLVAGGIGDDSLKGGAGDDLLNGGRSVKGEWSFFLSAGAISARHLDAALTLSGAELVQAAEFGDASPELAFLAADAQHLEGVALLYAALGRAPDLAGLSFWSRAGTGLRDVAEGVLRSAEWGATPLGQAGDDAFVRGMYRDMLGRQVDEAGKAFWMQHLASGSATRGDVLMAVAFSGEHRAAALTKDGYLIGQESLAGERGWLSSSGNDRLEGGSGNDQLVGGDGFDTAVFAGARDNYRILLGADGTLRVADGIDRTVDSLSGIEALEFGDGTLDLSFLAQAPELLGAAGLLYQAVLDRAGDAAGLAWWLGLDLQVEQMAHAFAGSAEFQARFGAMSDAEFVRALYANSGLDAAAAGGMAAWENFLDGHSRAELVAAWIAEDSVLAAHDGSHGIWLL